VDVSLVLMNSRFWSFKSLAVFLRDSVYTMTCIWPSVCRKPVLCRTCTFGAQRLSYILFYIIWVFLKIRDFFLKLCRKSADCSAVLSQHVDHRKCCQLSLAVSSFSSLISDDSELVQEKPNVLYYVFAQISFPVCFATWFCQIFNFFYGRLSVECIWLDVQAHKVSLILAFVDCYCLK